MRPVAAFLVLLLPLGVTTAPGLAQGFHERDPIRYGEAIDDNAITRLDRRLAAGELTLPREGRQGRLRPLLRALGVPESSQTIVFSKTSLHRALISPHNPRAIYFGPDVYVGYVPGASVLEIAAGDPDLGMVFYTLPQAAGEPPRLRRDDSCLACHASARTDYEPGLLLRSVFPDAHGEPIAAAGDTAVTLALPLPERWGGWLVTGTFAAPHRGNGLAIADERGRHFVAPRPATDLRAFADWFDADQYLVPTSDIGALLAFEQQAVIHNLLIRSRLQMRWLLANEQAMRRTRAVDVSPADADRVIDTLARRLAAALLLRDEAPMTDPAAAPLPEFAGAFAALSPAGPDGERLGRLDLRHRLFDLPMSPMIHAPAFTSLPAGLRDRVLARIRRTLSHQRLAGNDPLAREQRRRLHEHLAATVAGY